MYLDKDVCYRALLTRDARFDGKFFVAVKTTGVYCRPICPAQTPKRLHIEFMPSAAAAQEAGFRPCLRCRPETTPDLAAWHGTSATVSRAMALIEAGALNDGNVEDLAYRLGLGERQLRRLFQHHIGASPRAVAQTRRVLLAKQLISDTDLTLVQVAYAAGFGSVRRFNDTFRKLYGRPPGTLRRAGSSAGVATSVITITLSYKPPYDWRAMLDFLAARAIPRVEYVDQGSYARTISLDGARGTIHVRRGASAGAAECLVATIRFPVISALPIIIGRIRKIFDLSADPAAIDAHLSGDAVLAQLVERRPGLRVPGAWDGFELAVRAILGQQVSVSAATKLAGKLVGAYGTPFRTPDDAGTECPSYVFPAPWQLASGDLAKAIGMPRARAEAISSLARALQETPNLLNPGQNTDDTMLQLIAIPGIGEWTAQYIAMRALSDPDAFPAADVGLLRAFSPEKRAASSELLARAEAWRPWRAYGALHLWAAGSAASDLAKEERNEVVARPHSLPNRDAVARL